VRVAKQASDVSDVWLLPLTGDRKPRPLLNSSFGESDATVSPDGKWLAYQSTETGRSEVYVRPYPSGPGKWLISKNGGAQPRWRADGAELYFVEPHVGSGESLMAVGVRREGERLQFGAPQELFRSFVSDPTHPPHLAYAVSRDGQRFVMPRRLETETAATPGGPIAIVMNWAEGLPQ
jgi:hypothetical protein